MTTATQKKERTFVDILTELRKPIPENLIRYRDGWKNPDGSIEKVAYLEWHTVADILDMAGPDWNHCVKDIRQIGDIMTVTVAITIDGITREGIGTGLANSEMGIKKAEHDALKRAAVKFGIARGLYHKESEIIEREGSVDDKKDDSAFPSNPLANGVSDLVTPKQLGMIIAVARERGYDPDEECRKLLQCGTDELSRRAASCFIGHLQQLDQRTFAPTSGANNETHTDQAERWRNEMADGYAEVGLDPSKVLAEYDTRCNMIDDKRNAHTATMKKVLLKKIEQVKHVFADSQWTSSDIAKELKKHGITGAIENAKPDAINSIWADYKQARMI